MALRKYSDFIGMDQETLDKDLTNALNQLHSLKLEHKIKGLQNPKQILFLRREIAMMKTELTKRSTVQA